MRLCGVFIARKNEEMEVLSKVMNLNPIYDKTLNQSSQREKTQRGTFFAKTFQRGTFLLFLPLSISSSLRKLLLLHNLSRINTHDKFTLEDAVITEMIGSKLRIFFKSRNARYRSLARVVWACFCYKFLRFNHPHFVYVSTHYRALKRILFT